ncbi:MAG TPA: 50S ribosomal protein L9 [Terriglobia bacterium]|jgi:large subunit ribosomal protein L9|nr:50S ribosomal protein L9 [Terriglobia bacterium]
MDVILLDNVDRLGTRGQVVKVADGYGRNYLLPKKLAVAATPQNRRWVEQQRVRFLKLEAKEKADAEDLAKLLELVSLSFKRKAGEKGALFGSVTALDVAEGLAAQGYRIDRRKIQLDQPIKSMGEFNVAIKLHPQVTASLKITVEGEIDAQAQAQAEAKAKMKAEAKAEAKAKGKAKAETPAAEGESGTKPETK